MASPRAVHFHLQRQDAVADRRRRHLNGAAGTPQLAFSDCATLPIGPCPISAGAPILHYAGLASVESQRRFRAAAPEDCGQVDRLYLHRGLLSVRRRHKFQKA